MAAASDIGVSASNYTGNAALGGGSFGVAQIDTRPLQQLAHYTFIYNKAEYDQRQKDAEKAAEDIASLSSYDTNTSIKKDLNEVHSGLGALRDFVRDNPQSLNYKNKEQWMEYQRRKGDFENKLASAKSRSVMNLKREEEIANETTPALKVLYRKMLDEEITSTDILTPLRHTGKSNLTQVPYKAAPMRELNVSEIGKIFTPKQNISYQT